MDKRGEGKLLLGLPRELLSAILLEIPTKEMYPSCFLVSKQFLETVLDEVAWEQRCLRELKITQRVKDSWFLTYQGIALLHLCHFIPFNLFFRGGSIGVGSCSAS